jgi:hypothetical protein
MHTAGKGQHLEGSDRRQASMNGCPDTHLATLPRGPLSNSSAPVVLLNERRRFPGSSVLADQTAAPVPPAFAAVAIGEPDATPDAHLHGTNRRNQTRASFRQSSTSAVRQTVRGMLRTWVCHTLCSAHHAMTNEGLGLVACMRTAIMSPALPPGHIRPLPCGDAGHGSVETGKGGRNVRGSGRWHVHFRHQLNRSCCASWCSQHNR